MKIFITLVLCILFFPFVSNAQKYVGINVDTPTVEIDVRTLSTNDGAEVSVGNINNSFFLRMFSGRDEVPFSAIYWKTGTPLVFGRAAQNGANFTEFVRLDGKTIGVFNTGRSVFLGAGAGTNDDVTNRENIAIGDSSMHNNISGMQNTAVGAKSLFSNTDRSNLVAVGDSALYSNGTGATESWHGAGNSALGARALLSNSYGWSNTAIGNRALYSNTIGHNNSAIGREALASNTEGERNTAMGRSALVSNIDGDENTAVGVDAMKLNTSGFKNTAVGRSALHQNTTGSNNVAIGRSALWYNETGSNNIAIGNEALSQNTDRSGLVAIGDSALFNNGLNTDFGNPIGAFFNTAIGSKALRSNETGAKNTAVGYSALYHCIDGGTNTAIGYNALYENIDGSANTAIGSAALTSNNDGDGNTAIGRTALATLENADHNTAIGAGAAGSSESGSNNVAVGYGALSYNTTGSMNTIVGAFAGESLFGLTSSRNVFIGYAAGRFENESDRLYIDNTSSTSPLIYGEFDNDLLKINGEFISSIPRSGLSNFVAKIENTKNNNTSRNEGLLIVAGHGIYNASNESSLLQFENPSGDYMGRIKQVGMTSIALITTSDQRLKHRISSTQYGLKDLMAIQVKDYYYQSDDSGTQETGFLAQQLYQHYPDAVDVGGEDVTKEPWGVAYGKLSPLLVKSIQDQQEIIQEQQEIIEHQDDRIAKLESQVSRLTKIFEQSRGKSCSEVKPDRH